MANPNKKDLLLNRLFCTPSSAHIIAHLTLESRIIAYLSAPPSGPLFPQDIEWLIATPYKLFGRHPRDIPPWAILDERGELVEIGEPPESMAAIEESLMPEPVQRTQWMHFLKSVNCIKEEDCFWIGLTVERLVSGLLVPNIKRGIRNEEYPSRLSAFMRYSSLMKGALDSLSPLPPRFSYEELKAEIVQLPYEAWIFENILTHDTHSFGEVKAPVADVLNHIWAISDLAGQILGPASQPHAKKVDCWDGEISWALKRMTAARHTILTYLPMGMHAHIPVDCGMSRELFFVVYGTAAWFFVVDKLFVEAYNKVNGPV